MNYWLVKSEPAAYSWADFTRDGSTDWTGVRNYQARNFLRAMQPGDLVLYYHSVTDKQIVGVAEVAAPAAPDTTAPTGSDWVAVRLRPREALATPVTLAPHQAGRAPHPACPAAPVAPLRNAPQARGIRRFA